MSRLEPGAFVIAFPAQCSSVGSGERKQYLSLGCRLRRSKFGDSLYCVLVETNRVNGSPRQKVVCYLGSLDEGHRESVWTRVDFWDRATAKLDQLQLTHRERTKIEES